MKRLGLPRFATAYALVLALLAVPAAAGTPQLFGIVRLGAGSVDSAPSFLAGGFGKTLAGGLPADVVDETGAAELATGGAYWRCHPNRKVGCVTPPPWQGRATQPRWQILAGRLPLPTGGATRIARLGA